MKKKVLKKPTKSYRNKLPGKQADLISNTAVKVTIYVAGMKYTDYHLTILWTKLFRGKSLVTDCNTVACRKGSKYGKSLLLWQNFSWFFLQHWDLVFETFLSI